jgi:hypothetical protein
MTHTEKQDPDDAADETPTAEAPPKTTEDDGTPVENPSG